MSNIEHTDIPRIFVQIATYRDPECQYTVKDLFDKASHPERVFVGLCWQTAGKADSHCFIIPPPLPENVRSIEIEASQSDGVCWARRQTQTLWNGEEYTLVTDSHMRFIPGWDEAMIEELNKCPSGKPLLSCHPAAYTPPDNLDPNPRLTFQRVHTFNKHGEVRCRGEYLDRPPPAPLNGAFIAGGFMFSSSDVIEEVPYDPYLYFDQEEIAYSARLYTHGWDVFSTSRTLLYHYYNNPDGKQRRPLHWEDRQDWFELQERGRKRYRHLFDIEKTQDTDALQELEDYGFGTKRGLKDYENYTGIDFKNLKTTNRALRCHFIIDLEKYKDNPVYIPEVDGEYKMPALSGMEEQKSQEPQAVVKMVDEPLSPLKPLTIGDIVPFFALPDQHGKLREIQNYGGKPTALCYLPIHDIHYVQAFFDALDAKREAISNANFHRIYLLKAPIEMLASVQKTLQRDVLLWSDADGALSRALGIENQALTDGVSFLLDTNLRIHTTIPKTNAEKHLAFIVEYIQKIHNNPLKLHAPALIIPNALNPEMIERILDYWREGQQYSGTIGTSINRQGKRRTDVDVRDKEFLRELDDALAKTVFPEVTKVAGFKVGYRDRYKIGCYAANDEGFYNQHRDTGIPPLAHRRYSMSIALNDNFDGGELYFSEYNFCRYRIPKGAAVLFPSPLLHGVQPVTKGERFVMVSFLHGDAEETYRKQHCVSTNTPYYESDCKLLTETTFPSLPLSDSVYTNNILENQALGNPLKKIFPTPHLFHKRVDVPPEVLVIENYVSPEACKILRDYADTVAGRKLLVLDNEKTSTEKVVTKESSGRVTDYVAIDGMADEILGTFLDIYTQQLSPFFDTKFEWFERPQILRYSTGGKYDRHSDSEHWIKESDSWKRSQDRDYSVLLYLNEDYQGGALEFCNFNYRIQPKAGMLIGFPSDHRYLHAALPVTEGMRYVIVSWGAELGTARVREKPPYAATYINLRR